GVVHSFPTRRSSDLGGVEGVLGQDFAGVGVDDGGLVVVDEADDLGAGAGSADAEVEQAAAVAEADLSVAGRRSRNARTRGSGPADRKSTRLNSSHVS